MSVVGATRRGALAGLVHARRRALGLTRHALATQAGVAWATLVAIEVGQTDVPARATLVALAGALDLPLAALQATLPPAPTDAQAERGPGAARSYGCLGCGRARGEVRQALIAKRGAQPSLWLCPDCAENDASVAELVAAYRRTRAGGG